MTSTDDERTADRTRTHVAYEMAKVRRQNKTSRRESVYGRGAISDPAIRSRRNTRPRWCDWTTRIRLCQPDVTPHLIDQDHLTQKW